MQQEYQCICNSSLSSFWSVKQHIPQCHSYLRRCYFLSSYQRIPKQQSINDLELLRAEVQIVQQRIRERIYEATREKKTEIVQNKFEPIQDMNHIEQKQMIIEQDVGSVYSSDIIECLNCHNKFYASLDTDSLFYVQQCWHLFCKPCIIKHIDKQFVERNGNVMCPMKECPNAVPRMSIQQLIGKEKLMALQDKVVKKISNVISCFKCKCEFMFEPGKPESVKDLNGKPLTKAMEKHYAENRFSCMKCKTQQCRKCSASPYHTGKTCEQFKQHSQSMKCRYCLDVMPEINTSTGMRAFYDICSKKQCQQQVKGACAKMLACGHPCRGIAGEKQCLPCLDEKCSGENKELMGQKGQDYCSICYIEALDSSPCIRSVCGHIFHRKCLAKRFEIRWIGPRILFNFCLCPLCKKWIQLQQGNPLNVKIEQNKSIYDKIKSKCAQRLKFQGCEKDEKLVNPGSPYFNKPTDYALAIFAYYQCYKCKQPYFGGRKSCQNAAQQNQSEFDVKQLICSNCCQIPIENCLKHGKQYIEFKCRFCCSVAQWFCWGNTHFCEGCHQKQCKGEYISKYPKSKLPKCLGPDKCPVGGNHDGNGDEKPIGCAICRNIKESRKDF